MIVGKRKPICCKLSPRKRPFLKKPVLGGPFLLYRLDVLAFSTIDNVKVRQSVQVNTANKSHRSLATRTLHLDRTILRFGRFHLSQCSALPARRIPKKVSGTGQMPWTLNSVPVGFTMKLNSACAVDAQSCSRVIAFSERAAWQRRLPPLGSVMADVILGVQRLQHHGRCS